MSLCEISFWNPWTELISVLKQWLLIPWIIIETFPHAWASLVAQTVKNLLVMQEFSSVQPLRPVWLFVTPWTASHQAFLSITNSRSLLKLMSIESVMPSNYLILCRPLILPPSIFPSIRVFSNESVLCIRWLKYWSFHLSISPSNEYSGLISFRMDGLVWSACSSRDSQDWYYEALY